MPWLRSKFIWIYTPAKVVKRGIGSFFRVDDEAISSSKCPKSTAAGVAAEVSKAYLLHRDDSLDDIIRNRDILRATRTSAGTPLVDRE